MDNKKIIIFTVIVLVFAVITGFVIGKYLFDVNNRNNMSNSYVIENSI